MPCWPSKSRAVNIVENTIMTGCNKSPNGPEQFRSVENLEALATHNYDRLEKISLMSLSSAGRSKTWRLLRPMLMIGCICT